MLWATAAEGDAMSAIDNAARIRRGRRMSGIPRPDGVRRRVCRLTDRESHQRDLLSLRHNDLLRQPSERLAVAKAKLCS